MSAFAEAAWRTSGHSGGEYDDCTEPVAVPDAVGVRDSKNPDVGHLRIERRHPAVLLAEVESGRHDLCGDGEAAWADRDRSPFHTAVSGDE